MKKDMPMTEALKIRHHIMNIIYHNPKHPVKLLSIRMMAEKFGVASSTVYLVMKKLEKEGFVVARQGLGNFTVPMDRDWRETKPLIGIIIGFGRHFLYTRWSWMLLSRIGMGLTERGFNVRHVQLLGLSEDAVFEEIKNSYLDGLIWVESDEVTEKMLQNLENAGLPVLTVNIPFSSINNINIRYDEYASGEELGRTAAEVMTRLVLEHDRRVDNLHLPGKNNMLINTDSTT